MSHANRCNISLNGCHYPELNRLTKTAQREHALPCPLRRMAQPSAGWFNNLAGATLPSPGVTFEEQRLTQHSRHRRRLKRLGDQESRFRTLARKEALWVGGDENDRHFKRPQHFVHCIKTRAAVRELNIREDDPGTFGLCQCQSLGVCAGNAEHAVAETFHQTLYIQCDERFVFNNQYVSRDLSSEFAPGFFDKSAQSRRVDIEHLGGVVLGQPLEGDEQKRLAWLRRNLGEMALDRLTRAPARRLAIQRDGIPDLREKPIERYPSRKAGIQNLGVLDQGFESCGHIGIAGG